MKNFSIIGAGNLAFTYSKAFTSIEYQLEYVYNRDPQKGQHLTEQISGSKYTENLLPLLESDFVFLTISDNAIQEIVNKLTNIISSTKKNKYPIFVHCSGSTPINVFSPLDNYNISYGVLYPLMTITKDQQVDFKEVPFFIEGNSEDTVKQLGNIAANLGAKSTICNSEKRLKLHLAGVFACNFTNYVLDLAYELDKDNYNYLFPTTLEMIQKCFRHPPKDVRTGPAIREDYNTIEKHKALLQDSGYNEQLEIYNLLTNNIINRKNGKL